MAITLPVKLLLGVFYHSGKHNAPGMLKPKSVETKTENLVQNMGAQICMPSKKVACGIRCHGATQPRKRARHIAGHLALLALDPLPWRASTSNYGMVIFS